MDEICRLCCSKNFVNNPIFDEDGALYIKMSLYLPIKVFKNDRLPQKICDKCSCKVNDFYQFCNEAIEVQNRLQSKLELLKKPIVEANTVDLTRIKDNLSPVPHMTTQSTQTELGIPELSVKEEPTQATPQVKLELDNENADDFPYGDIPSDDSNVSLNTLKKKKKKLKRVKSNEVNGERKKRKRKMKELADIVKCALPEGTTITALVENGAEVLQTKEGVNLSLVKTEDSMMDLEYGLEYGLEVDQWRCCICFITGGVKTEMLDHYKSHAEEEEDDLERPESPVVTPAGLLKCTHCSKMFSDRSSWQKHCLRHGRRPFRCGLCEKTFKDVKHILRHGQTHSYGESTQPLSKRFVCDLCPEEFVYMRYLLEHRSTAHPEAQDRKLVNKCMQCGREFAHLNSLRRHLRSHSGERNYLCNVCGKALSSREHLKFHIRIHTGYKPNICKTCGKGFAKKCNLTLHERVHSGEKPHVCSHCGKAFSQRSTLVIHERYHSGARPYVCSLCGRGFVAKGLLSMHLKTTCI